MVVDTSQIDDLIYMIENDLKTAYNLNWSDKTKSMIRAKLNKAIETKNLIIQLASQKIDIQALAELKARDQQPILISKSKVSSPLVTSRNKEAIRSNSVFELMQAMPHLF